MKTLLLYFSMLIAGTLMYAQEAGLKTCKEELARAERLKNKDSIAFAYCHLSEYYAYRQADSARYCCEQGLRYAHKDTAEPYLTLLNNLADSYFASGNVGEAIKQFQFTLKEAERLKWGDIQKASVLSSLGVAYRRKESPDSALIYYSRALQQLEGREACDERTQLLANMAVLYANTSRLKEGEYYARKAVETSKGCIDLDMVLYAASTAGAILTIRKKYAEAAQMLYPALAKAREQRKPKFVLKTLTYLLSTYYRMNNTDSINHYIKEAHKAMVGLPEASAEVQGYREVLLNALTKMKRYRESLTILQQMLKTKDAGLQSPIDRIYMRMARNYMGLKDYTRATEYYEKAYQTADSLHQTEIDSQLSELSMKYENQEKALEIARLTQEHLEQKAKTMQWSIVAGTTVFAFVLLSFYYLFRQKRIKKEEELKLAQSYIEGLECERTRFAKELHDGVCNDLLGIGMQMQCMQPTAESKQEVLNLLEQVRTDVRCISHELMPPKFQQTTLAEAMEDYLMRLTLSSSIQLAFSKENEDAEWRQVPEQTAYEVYRILQELLSNILKHSEATEVCVNLSLKGDVLTLLISDNGKNFSGVDAGGKGIGLNTIQERVKAINGVLVTQVETGRQLFKLVISLTI